MFQQNLASTLNESELIKISESKVAVVRSLWHQHITRKSLDTVINLARKYHIKQLQVYECVGAYEIPYTVKFILEKNQQPYDGIIVISCIIKGETDHYFFIAHSVINTLLQISVNYLTPLTISIITTENEQQALRRAIPSATNAFIALAKLMALHPTTININNHTN